MKIIKEPCEAHYEFYSKCAHCQEQPILIKREDVLKLIDEYSKKRLYRSKACQLLIRMIKKRIKT